MCFHSFATKKELKFHEKVYKNKDFGGIVMPSEKGNILEFNQNAKPDKMPYIESIIKKIDGFANNPEKSLTTKLGEHIPCQYSKSTIAAYSICNLRFNVLTIFLQFFTTEQTMIIILS